MPGQNELQANGDFVAELCEELSAYRGPECREQERMETPPISVVVQPLDANMQPSGRTFSAVLRNISDGGIGLSFGEPIRAEFIEVQGVLPSGKVFSTIVQVRHCTPSGVMIGGNFVDSHPHRIV